MSEVIPREIFYMVIDDIDDFASIGRLLTVASWLAKYIVDHADAIADRFVITIESGSGSRTSTQQLPNGKPHGVTQTMGHILFNERFRLGKKHGRWVYRSTNEKNVHYWKDGVRRGLWFRRNGDKTKGLTVTIVKERSDGSIQSYTTELWVEISYDMCSDAHKNRKCTKLKIKYVAGDGQDVTYNLHPNCMPEPKEKLLMQWFERNTDTLIQTSKDAMARFLALEQA